MYGCGLAIGPTTGAHFYPSLSIVRASRWQRLLQVTPAVFVTRQHRLDVADLHDVNKQPITDHRERDERPKTGASSVELLCGNVLMTDSIAA